MDPAEDKKSIGGRRDHSIVPDSIGVENEEDED
jgi:hypothetical protein